MFPSTAGTAGTRNLSSADDTGVSGGCSACFFDSGVCVTVDESPAVNGNVLEGPSTATTLFAPFVLVESPVVTRLSDASCVLEPFGCELGFDPSNACLSVNVFPASTFGCDFSPFSGDALIVLSDVPLVIFETSFPLELEGKFDEAPELPPAHPAPPSTKLPALPAAMPPSELMPPPGNSGGVGSNSLDPLSGKGGCDDGSSNDNCLIDDVSKVGFVTESSSTATGFSSSASLEASTAVKDSTDRNGTVIAGLLRPPDTWDPFVRNTPDAMQPSHAFFSTSLA
ncbi:hypothetical protein MOQ_006983 [Trypanosoma cruzi marinkellei]|uniref:Uncharacterized protein n=1 Tax=Trypanosoma cruzi marinkellei TaxID=85056 RepID=K2MU58_TRYCR|nr:hypothetical protein MOQ_006983 [Trypanosoma cruzi marinkellei]